ncbi:MAG: hypothetical protein WEB59_09570 [Thermoanaerobaculia bacterium]
MRAARFTWNLALVAATVFAAAALLIATLIVPPIVGMADNGDFDRVLNPAGLTHESERDDERYFQWMQPRFTRVARAPDPSFYRTCESLLVEVAMGADGILSSAPSFDVRFLAAVHILLLLAALGLLVLACRDLPFASQVVVAALLVFFFTDVGYTAAFNSVYSQTPSFLFLLLTAGVAACAIRRERLEGVWLLAYFLCAALFICSKPQESIQAPLLAVFGARLSWSGAGRARRAAAIVLALALVGFAWRYYRSAQGSIGSTVRYNMLFLEILPHSPDPAGDLAELGLDPGWVRYTGIPPWGPRTPFLDPAFRAHFEAGSGHPSPRTIYLRHPERLIEVLARTAKASYALRPTDLGNFAKESGALPLEMATWPAAWSRIRARLSGLPWLIVLFIGNLFAAAATWASATTRGRFFREGLIVLILMASGAFLASSIGDYHGELERHLYVFHALCDLILIADLAWLAQDLAEFAASRRPVLSSAPSRVGL